MSTNDGGPAAFKIIVIGDQFRRGELWESPRGKLWRVESVSARTASLVSHGDYCRGMRRRRARRPWDAVIGWVIKECARENGNG